MRGLVLPVLVLAAWEAASHCGLVDPRLLPPLERVLSAGDDVTGLRHVGGDLIASLRRDLAGFGLGTLCGLVFGALLGRSRMARALLGPSFDVFKQIAVFAWIPLISMWCGAGEAAKVVFVALTAFTPVVLNTAQGARSTPPALIEVGRLLRFTRAQMVWRVYLPAALPAILTGVHLALIYAWLATIGAEYFMTTGPGIGGLIIEGRDRFAMDLVMLGVLLLGVVGYALNRIAEAAEYRLLRWRPA
ncbi:MAG TPA: ABC transporter permease [Acidisphaera sp.]|nr:ABC transporter permease [Acidisphaera sp.]